MLQFKGTIKRRGEKDISTVPNGANFTAVTSEILSQESIDRDVELSKERYLSSSIRIKNPIRHYA